MVVVVVAAVVVVVEEEEKEEEVVQIALRMMIMKLAARTATKTNTVVNHDSSRYRYCC